MDFCRYFPCLVTNSNLQNLGLRQLFLTVSCDTPNCVLVSLKLLKQHTRQGLGPLKGSVSAQKVPQWFEKETSGVASVMAGMGRCHTNISGNVPLTSPFFGAFPWSSQF